ncbi:hypothetical protein C8Q77DRAFT_292155 [Trametes polyzona]|nr:hypothetical protein C8Q77DRAFT_292155 [Trametes polyzona]
MDLYMDPILSAFLDPDRQRPRQTISPNPQWYAVIRINPLANVKDLDDPLATAAAKAMTTKPYLVFLEREPSLPFPNRPWYRYRISVVTSSLRDPDEAQGYTADMCTPIFPNTSHPTGRTPVRPDKPFPYGHCYHWMGMEMDVRVLAKPELFDQHVAVELPVLEHLRMKQLWQEDQMRIIQSHGVESPAASFASFTSDAPSQRPRELGDCNNSSGRILSHNSVPPDERSVSPASFSDSASDRGTTSDDRDADSVEDIVRMDIFSGPNDDVALLPLCELWEDLKAVIKNEGDIPHPAGLFKERGEIVQIVREARIRAYAAMTAHAPSSEQEYSERVGDRDRGSKRASRRFTYRLGMGKVARKIGHRFKSLAARASPRFAMPYIPVWP